MSDCHRSRPLVGVVADYAFSDGVPVNSVRSRYLEALSLSADVTPLVLPSVLAATDIDHMLQIVLDGLFLTGSISNVDPALYGAERAFNDELLDPQRDRIAFKAVQASLRFGKPIFGVCRGLQEMNVALGGTLRQDLKNARTGVIHQEDVSLPRDRQYRASHSIQIRKNSVLADLLGDVKLNEFRVNSLHTQAIGDVASRIDVDAWSADGVVEAISVRDAISPAVAVQWHPEWFHEDDTLSASLFRGFGRMCRDQMNRPDQAATL